MLKCSFILLWIIPLVNLECIFAYSKWGFSKFFGTTTADSSKPKEKWSSMLTVDPSRLIGLMVNHGGLILPAYVKKDMETLSMLCHAEEVKLNVYEKQLLVRKFAVRLPDSEDALRIDKILVCWDSYRHPCIEVEVDDVYVLIEFFDLLLIKNNW